MTTPPQITIDPYECCYGCHYWRRRDADSSFGECHRRAPSTDRNSGTVAVWPVTHKDNDCGEWRRKE